jgi:myo-inositol 2-dehydrogenase/D-chiro-inositol 1-dehydrogenase
VVFNRRFDPHYRALRERVTSCAIGAIESIHIVNHDPAPPPLDFIPRSGGLLKDFTILDFDMAAWLLAEPIAEVFAWASCLVDPRIAELGDVDTAKVLLRTATGRLCMISNSRRAAHGYDQRIEVFGSRGAARVDNVEVTRVSQWSAEGMATDPIQPAFPQRYAGSYAAEVDHFAELLDGTATPAAGYAENVGALALAEAAARSIASGAPIRI